MLTSLAGFNEVVTNCRRCAVARSPSCVCKLSANALVKAWKYLHIDERWASGNAWGDVIYFCVPCDEAGRGDGEHHLCEDYPLYHDKSGYHGSGRLFPKPLRRLARRISLIRG